MKICLCLTSLMISSLHIFYDQNGPNMILFRNGGLPAPLHTLRLGMDRASYVSVVYSNYIFPYHSSVPVSYNLSCYYLLIFYLILFYSILYHNISQYSLPCCLMIHYILVGGLEHFLFSHIVGIIIPIDELIFFRGVAQPPTMYRLSIYDS